jgi:hypothetical protein
VGVAHRPPQPLDEMGGEMVGLKIGGADPLTQHHGVFSLLAGRISKHDYLGHRFLLLDDCSRPQWHGRIRTQ